MVMDMFIFLILPVFLTYSFTVPLSPIVHKCNKGCLLQHSCSISSSRFIDVKHPKKPVLMCAQKRSVNEEEHTFQLLDDFLDVDDEDIDQVSVDDDREQELDTNFSLSNLTLAGLSSNVSYFYLRNEVGLSDSAMWRISFQASSVLGMTSETIRKKVKVLQETMNLSTEELRLVIERQPTILQLSADKNIAPSILFLVRSLDLGKDELRQLVVSEPPILTYSKNNVKSKIRFFTAVLGFSIQESRELFLAEPKLLRPSVRMNLVPKLRFLMRDVELPLVKLRLIVQKHPLILLYSLENNLVPKLIFYFIMTLHMTTEHVHKILISFPAILSYNLDRHILPISRFFIKDLEISPTEFRGILLKYPRLMSNSLAKVKHVVGYFRYELGLTASQVKRVFYQSPTIVGLNTENNLRQKVEFLRSTFQLNDEQLNSVVAGMPTLLVLNVERNLIPKTEYLLRSFDEDTAALSKCILRFPTILGYSFDLRLRPRMEAIREAGLDPSCIAIGMPLKQDDFEGWLHRRAEKHKLEASIVKNAEKNFSAKSLTNASSWPPSSESADRPARIIHWIRERRTL